MSDLQIVTGVSILISGYAQLRCGLSTYHWQDFSSPDLRPFNLQQADHGLGSFLLQPDSYVMPDISEELFAPTSRPKTVEAGRDADYCRSALHRDAPNLQLQHFKDVSKPHHVPPSTCGSDNLLLSSGQHDLRPSRRRKNRRIHGAPRRWIFLPLNTAIRVGLDRGSCQTRAKHG
jgi:hypothetical protein